SLRQSGTLHFNVCGFSALRAEKPHTNDSASTMLPQGKSADSPPLHPTRTAHKRIRFDITLAPAGDRAAPAIQCNEIARSQLAARLDSSHDTSLANEVALGITPKYRMWPQG